MVDDPVIPANPRKRRQALFTAIAMMAVGIVAFVVLRGQLAQINLALDAGDNAQAIWLSRRIGIVVLSALLLSGLGLALITEKVARMSLQQGRFPPQGVDLLNSTRLRTSAELRRSVLWLRIAAGLLVLLTGALTAWSGVLLYRLY